jgi:hypothetical protein
MKLLAKLSLFIFLFSPLVHAKDDSVNQKLDLILEKLGGLETRVSSLEQSNQSVKSEIQHVEKKIEEQKVNEKIILPSEPEEKSSFLSNLRKQLKSEEDKASGPWALKSSWTKIRKNLTRYQVRMILGNPHEVKTSLDPRIDDVYFFSGDLDADGAEDIGIVNFYRDRVVSFTSPY